jgi:hypothetical protein
VITISLAGCESKKGLYGRVSKKTTWSAFAIQAFLFVLKVPFEAKLCPGMKHSQQAVPRISVGTETIVHNDTKSSNYTQGYHESVTRSHTSRAATKDAAFLLPHIQPHHEILDIGCGPGTITSGSLRLRPPTAP